MRAGSGYTEALNGRYDLIRACHRTVAGTFETLRRQIVKFHCGSDLRFARSEALPGRALLKLVHFREMVNQNPQKTGRNPAPGGPGIPPRWTRGAKDAVGTAYAVSSRVWYTLSNGVITEVYYPTIDTHQLRDIQFLVTDGETFFHDSTGIGLIPEQIWDAPDLPKAHMYFGRAYGSADPLMWAHAEYVKLLRSVADGKLFDIIDVVATRYCTDRPRRDIEIWKMNHQVRTVPAGCQLHILAVTPLSLHWSDDEWATKRDSSSIPTSIGIEYVDIQVAETQNSPIRFTFCWPEESRWQGSDFEVQVLH